MAAQAFDVHERFSRYGLDSLKATGFLAEVGERLGRVLSPTLVWEHPTLDALSRHLAGEPVPAAARPAHRVASREEPIAIVGMACRYPRAPDPEAYWRLLSGGVDAICEVPAGRWDASRTSTRWGGFLEQVEGFDPLFFGISPKEALHMDPQQRLMLELTWEALEDAGIAPERLQGSLTGVCFGMIWTDYETLAQRLGPERISQHTATGFHHSIVANRVSYLLGLRGPSLAIDTACSSSLAAVHLACESLRRGEATLALAGGVNLNLAPDSTMAMSKVGALSPDGRCFSFDARANGYVRGEGAGVVVLKPLSRALADGDPIACVIRGGALNNNGGSNGLTAPNRQAQEELLHLAYARAGVTPSEVQYVEAHGTGTQLGDPMEARALGEVLGAGRSEDQPLRIGSCKTNIGHLEAAAGVAGLIKVALAIKHRALPPSLHFETPNPHIPFTALRLEVQRTLGPWPAPERKLVAGVSSFGFGGANCHVVVEEPEAPRAELVALSGASSEALQDTARRLLQALDTPGATQSLAEVGRSAAGPEEAPPHRLAMTVRSREELRERLGGFLRGEARAGVVSGVVSGPPGAPVFVFSGQGSQWPGMGRGLLRTEPVFRATLERCDRFIQAELGWSLLAELNAEAPETRLARIEVAFAAIVSLEIALAALWRSWGVEPAAVVGHSIGEVSAAHVAGILSLEDALRVICTQGRLLGGLSGQGAMGLVGLSWERCAALVEEYPGRLCRAIDAGPDSTVLSGEPEALAQVLATLGAQGVFCRRVETDVAVHSPQVDAVGEELLGALHALRPCRARVPFFSTVTASALEGEGLDAAHWVRNLARPVLFTGAITSALDQGHRVFLEVGPHPVVKHALESLLRPVEPPGCVLATLRQQEDERGVMLDTLGALYARGQRVAWDAVAGGRTPEGDEPVWVLPLSARSPGALEALARAHRARLAEGTADASLADLTYTAGARRGHLSHRVAVVGGSRRELAEALEAFCRGEARPGVSQGRVSPEGRTRVAFVFPGQGSQWLGMGRRLLREEPVFRASIEASERAMRAHVGWSLQAELDAEESRSRLEEIDVVQPVLFALQVALAALWRSWGIEPDAVVGHSMGEVAAAHVAGALGLEDAVRIICRRSQLLRRMSGQGAMAVVELGLAQAREALAGQEERLSVGVSNSARSTVISGDPRALEALLARLEGQGVFCRRVKVNVASHSPQMDPLKEELLRALEGLSPRAAPVPIYSTVTGRTGDGSDFHPAYWVDNLREPVLFHGAVERLLEDGHEVFLEVSPHPVLLAPLEETLRESKREAVALASLRRQARERSCLLESLAALYARGCAVDWTRLYPGGGRIVPLPHYPWQRERFWLPDESPADARPVSAVREGGSGHPLLGGMLSSSVQPGTHFWERGLSTAAFPYLADHGVGGEPVFPGAGYVEMALAAGAEVWGERGLVLEEVSLSEMLTLEPRAERAAQVVVSEQDEGRASFQISSRVPGGKAWRKHATGTLRQDEALPAALPDTPDTLSRRLPVVFSPEVHYQRRREQGLVYGPAFQAVRQLWRDEREGLGRLELPESLVSGSGAYRLHPSLLDACLQLAVELVAPWGVAPGTVGTHVPVGFARLRFFQRPGRTAWVWVKSLGEASAHEREHTFDLRLVDERGQPLVDIEGLRVYRLESGAAARKELGGWTYRVDWEPQPAAAELTWTARTPGSWLIFSDTGGAGQRLASLLRAHGETCVLVTPGGAYRRVAPGHYEVEPRDGEHLRRLLADAWGAGASPCRGVVHLWSLDAAGNDALTPSTLEAARRLGTTSVLHLVQALARTGWRDAPRLWLATRKACAVGETPEPLQVAQAPLWGMGQVLTLEQSELRCTRVDLDGDADACADALFQELASPGFEDQMAWRGDARFVARLSRAAETLGAREPATLLRAEGTYLLTGGLGGLGLEVARWLVAQGARHLLLMGRQTPSAEAERALAALREAGARVETVQGDVSRPEDVARALARVAEGMPPLRGVFHAAGLLDDGLLINLTEARFASVMAPKVQGAWNLHVQTRHLSLDLFVLFSSAIALLGSPGQANYAAANAFLDALAHTRRAEGLPALSLNWGTWTGVGLAAAQANRGERLEARGLRGLPPDKALAALGLLLGQPRPQVSVMALEPRQWLGFYLAAAQSPFFSRLAAEGTQRTAPEPGRARIREQLEAVQGSERRALLDQHLREQIGAVLRMAPSRIEPRAPLGSLGLDSLMSMEIRNRLEATLGLKLSATLVWTYPTLAALLPYLAEKMELPLEDKPDKGAEARAGGAPEPVRPDAALDSAIDEMSEEEVERLFAQRMAQGK